MDLQVQKSYSTLLAYSASQQPAAVEIDSVEDVMVAAVVWARIDRAKVALRGGYA
jgi:hypothetical protein